MEWAATLGLGAFLFFLIKGLLWLAVPIALGFWARSRKARAEPDASQ
jgi:hypothetical protein